MLIIMVFFFFFFIIVAGTVALFSLHAYTKWLWPWKLFLARADAASKVVEEHLDADCAVCLSHISQSEKFSVLPACNHGFHVHCIKTWLKYHPTCPLCRKTVAPLPPQLQLDCLPSLLLSLFRSICRLDLTLVISEIISNLEF
jgi:hypothetical protein